MMSIDTINTDLEAILAARADGRPVDPEVKRRVHERAEKVRAEILKNHGVQNIGVEIIRQIRDFS